MSVFRFKVGAHVMCNLGPDGWKLGRVIALNYREPHWPAQKSAPYQVMLEADHLLIYVPEDDARYCREATREDLRIAHRSDALAALPSDVDGHALESRLDGANEGRGAGLGCEGGPTAPGDPVHRGGRCHGCDCCPRSWSSVELYSEHYRCAERNGVPVTQCAIDLGKVSVGDALRHWPLEALPVAGGFMQCPTLVRLPPGVRFSDDGALAGEVRFDPHRGATYEVEFVAVSTIAWDKPEVGIVRLEIALTVEGNAPPAGFDVDLFEATQQQARDQARGLLRDLGATWSQWERGALSHRDTCDQMCATLRQLRALLEQHPRLDGGRWWTQLGGYHMNVHKLLENTLFECELYLGHALTFGSAEVRHMAEQNLAGCYQKRLLEAARFMWIDGVEQMMRDEWAAAAQTFQRAAAKQDGWGWAVNYGDIWLSEATARLVIGAERAASDPQAVSDEALWLAEVARLLEKGVARANEGRGFGPQGHPWAFELVAAFDAYRGLQGGGGDVSDWLAAFKLRTAYWCAQVLCGAPPFPPKPRPRLDDALTLVRRLPGHHD